MLTVLPLPECPVPLPLQVGAVPGYTTGHVDQNTMGGSFAGTMGGMSPGGVTGGMAGAKTWGPQPGYNNTMAPAGNLKVGPPCLPAWQGPSPPAVAGLPTVRPPWQSVYQCARAPLAI